jgi:AraC-like DNA-binding protein
MMLRQHLASYPPVEGLLALLGQRATGKAVIAMLRDPSYQWTLDELAARAAMSRATLIRSFGRLSGVAPLTFLTELRLALARRRLGRHAIRSAKSLPTSATSPKQLSVARSIGASGLGRADSGQLRAPRKTKLRPPATAQQRSGAHLATPFGILT